MDSQKHTSNTSISDSGIGEDAPSGQDKETKDRATHTNEDRR